MIDLTKIQFRERELVDQQAVELSALLSAHCQFKIDKAEIYAAKDWELYRREAKHRLKAEIWKLVYGDLRKPLLELRHDMRCAVGSIDSYQFHGSLTKQLDAILKMIECPPLEPDRGGAVAAANEPEHD